MNNINSCYHLLGKGKGKGKGFTLVEVLIAVVIFSLLMVLVSSAMGFSTRFWVNEHKQLTTKMKTFIQLEKLHRSVQAMQPYGVLYRNNEQLSLFFEGTTKQVTFVSSFGVYVKQPVLISLRIVTSNRSGTELQMAEHSLAETIFKNHSELSNIDWNWIPIKSNMLDANFRYYGYNSLAALVRNDNYQIKAFENLSWFDNYDGQETGILPNKITLFWQGRDNRGVFESFMEFDIKIDSLPRYTIIENTRGVR